MKTKLQFLIMGRIVILFTVAMLVSFIPEQYPKFFGDTYCDGEFDPKFNEDNKSIGSLDYPKSHCKDVIHPPTWHWGYRHWLWCFMGIILCILNASIVLDSLMEEDHAGKP